MSRLVKCKYCGISFDREHEAYGMVGARYAHQKCIDEMAQRALNAKAHQEVERQQNLNEYHEVLDFAKSHFEKPNYSLIQQQIKTYIGDKGYSYSGILKTLKYYYDIKGNPTSKSNGGIGIVPYCYDEAKQYFYQIWMANKMNADKTVVHEVEEIKINEPQRKPRMRKLFSFLDEEVNDGK